MIKIVAYKTSVIDNEILIEDSEGESIRSRNINKLLDFLNEPYTDKVVFAIKVFWDLDESLAPILRLLGVKACRELASPTHTYKDLFYIPSKVFSIHNQNQSYFYHLSQYYPDTPEPPDVYEIAGLGTDVLKGFNAMGLNPKKLTSPIAIYESEVLRHMEIPTVADIPNGQDGLLEFAQDCCGRLWIESYQVGHWLAGEVYEYDLRAAYPYIASKLRSLKYAKYAKSKWFDPNADWGFLRGELTIYDDVKVSPFFYDDEEGRMMPTGTWDTTITLHDYNFIKKWGIGEFKIDYGYYIKFTAPVMPLNIPLKRLFNQRGQGGIINSLAKRMATGVYGKCLEQHDDGTVGRYYNPIYAAMINSLNNIRVAEFIYENELIDDVVHIGVDSVISTKEAEVPKNGGMGKWQLSGIGGVIVLSAGRVFHGDKKPQGLNYNQIIDLINRRPRESYYTANLIRRQTLEESIRADDLQGLGRLKDTTSSFDLNLIRSNLDRIFPEFPMTGKELLNGQFKSIPINILPKGIDK